MYENLNDQNELQAPLGLEYPFNVEGKLDQPGLFGSAHRLLAHDNEPARRFRYLIGKDPSYPARKESASSTTAAQQSYSQPSLPGSKEPRAVENNISSLPPFQPQPKPQAYTPPNPSEAMAYPHTQFNIPVADTVADYDDDLVEIPLAPVLLTDRIALAVGILAAITIVITLFTGAGFYTGNNSSEHLLTYTSIASVIFSLLAALLTIPKFIIKRPLATNEEPRHERV